MNEIEKRYKENCQKEEYAENKFCEDIESLSYKYKDDLEQTFYENDEEDYFSMYKLIINIFIYEKLYTYEQDDYIKIGLLNSFKYLMKQFLYSTDDIRKVFEFEDEISNKICNYFSNFKFPKLNMQRKRDKLIDEINRLDNSNPYKLKLWYALLFSFFENLNEIEEMRMVDEALADYDFNYKMPNERKYYANEVFRQIKYIPDFSNVKIGQVWKGRNRKSDFIKDLKLKPMPAGKNSRKAQEDSISLSCCWNDDKEKGELTLIEIYPKRLEKKRKRTHKYEKYIETLLFYLLQEMSYRDVFITTKNKMFKDIKAISTKFNVCNLNEYESLINNLAISEKEFNNNLFLFRKIIRENFKKIINENIKYIVEKNVIHYESQLVIVVDNRHIKIADSKEELGISIAKTNEMIEVAKEFALKKLVANTKNKKIKTLVDIKLYNKEEEFKQEYENYIRKNYGWSYTYEGLFFSKSDDVVYPQITFEEYNKARKQLNYLLVDAMKKSILKKDAKLKMKCLKHEKEILNYFENDSSLKELYDTDIIDADSLIRKTQFKYPESFVQCIDTFIEHELKI